MEIVNQQNVEYWKYCHITTSSKATQTGEFYIFFFFSFHFQITDNSCENVKLQSLETVAIGFHFLLLQGDDFLLFMLLVLQYSFFRRFSHFVLKTWSLACLIELIFSWNYLETWEISTLCGHFFSFGLYFFFLGHVLASRTNKSDASLIQSRRKSKNSLGNMCSWRKFICYKNILKCTITKSMLLWLKNT